MTNKRRRKPGDGLGKIEDGDRLNNYSPAMHSTAETMTGVSAIYRRTSGRLP